MTGLPYRASAHPGAFYSTKPRRKAAQILFIRSHTTIEYVTAGIESRASISYVLSIFRANKTSSARRKLILMNDPRRPFRNGFKTYLIPLGIVDAEGDVTGGAGAGHTDVSRNPGRGESGLDEDRSESQQNDGFHDRSPDSLTSSASPDKKEGAPAVPEVRKGLKRP
jgi:hypothetical protein